MKIVVTGSDGFIARNIRVRLRELGYQDTHCVSRHTSEEQLANALDGAQFVFHLAGVNRVKEERDFDQGNAAFTRKLCARLSRSARPPAVAYASSTQAALENAYGRSKRDAETALFEYAARTGASVYVFRLTNVFGKWARPFYNSAVATFCHQAAVGLPFTIHDPNSPLRLLYIDDVSAAFVRLLEARDDVSGFMDVEPVYETSVGEVARLLQGFVDSRTSLVTSRVGVGFVRALYATYISYLPPASFSYVTPMHCDPRGEFVEMLKTPDCGQFSYFTALPGVTRGEHYHHSKTEKFLVIRGVARFAFRQIATGEKHELTVRGGEGRIVETIPGWAHNISNVGEEELVVMLWANEIFDRERPDTIAMQVAS